ncbi:MAG TPA: ferritin-like fold-containing protein [Actinomycetota bacterium]|nr:ferritin-like fold-containing protein [Actinomycetota bacterium]
MSGPVPQAVAEILAALSYGERLAERRARENVRLAPDDLRRKRQESVADRERENSEVLSARLDELGGSELEERFAPFFDSFFERTEPGDWLEAQAWHYIGDALVRDFADILQPALDTVTSAVVREALGERDEQEIFALDEVTKLSSDDPRANERVAAYARRVIGEALTQTRRALDATQALEHLLGTGEGEKRALLDLLQRHRERMDRLGIEEVD